MGIIEIAIMVITSTATAIFFINEARKPTPTRRNIFER